MTRLQTLKAELSAFEDDDNAPAFWDTLHQTLEKLARAGGATFDSCCRLETRRTLYSRIEEGDNEGLITEDGDPLITEGGDVILPE